MTLKNNIEAIIIKWAYQIDEVLSNDSAAGLNVNGNFPGPMTEIHFWAAKCMNLESLYDQTRAQTTRKMASILNLTDRLNKDKYLLQTYMCSISYLSNFQCLLSCVSFNVPECGFCPE